MPESSVRPLIEVLAQVPDFRKSQGRRHPWSAILAPVCAATLCGYRSYGAMAEWGRHYGAVLAQRLGFPHGKTPSVGTLHTVLRHLDKAALEQAVGAWVQAVIQQTPGRYQAIAVDGKTLCGSRWQGAVDVHLLSAVRHGLGLTLHQQAVPDKTNEIGAVQEVVAALVLEGRVLSVDALLTQKAVAEGIRAKGGTT